MVGLTGVNCDDQTITNGIGVDRGRITSGGASGCRRVCVPRIFGAKRVTGLISGSA